MSLYVTQHMNLIWGLGLNRHRGYLKSATRFINIRLNDYTQ